MSDDITTIRNWMANIEQKLQRIESKKALEDSVECKFKNRLTDVARAVDNRLERSKIECSKVYTDFCTILKDGISILDTEPPPHSAIDAGFMGLQFRADFLSRIVSYYADSNVSKSEFYDLGMAFDWLDSTLVRIPLFKCYE